MQSTQSDYRAIAEPPQSTQRNRQDASIARPATVHFLDQAALVQMLAQEFREEVGNLNGGVENLTARIAAEVERVCQKVDEFKPLGKRNLGRFL